MILLKCLRFRATFHKLFYKINNLTAIPNVGFLLKNKIRSNTTDRNCMPKKYNSFFIRYDAFDIIFFEH
jgi:hypothetical protein